jgi:large subunit ribosomal protein L21
MNRALRRSHVQLPSLAYALNGLPLLSAKPWVNSTNNASFHATSFVGSSSILSKQLSSPSNASSSPAAPSISVSSQTKSVQNPQSSQPTSNQFDEDDDENDFDDGFRHLEFSGKQSIRTEHKLPPFSDPRNPELKIANDELFAIVNFNGKQHKVGKGDLVMSTRIKHTEIGQKLTFDQVLLVGSRDFTDFGRPVVPNASVTAVVEEHTMTKKINVFHMKRRAGFKQLKRYRDQITMVRIEDIKYTPSTPAAK